MQDSLFPPEDDDEAADESAAPEQSSLLEPGPATEAPRPKAKRGAEVGPATPDAAVHALAEAMPAQLRLGTSSWNYPGWAGMVWEAVYPESVLSQRGIGAYAKHPLFRTVSLDRAFYRALTASQFADLAARVPASFRFVVKAPAMVTDALVRAEDGRGMQSNPGFLSAELAVQDFAVPALDGLGDRLGALVFQLSPLPLRMLDTLPSVLEKLRAMLAALPALRPIASDAVVAVEVRDPEWIGGIHGPAFVQVLKDTGATFCLGLHAKMPAIAEQLHMLRALWPGPLVCRWNLNRLHGGYGYEEAEKLYQPFDRMVDPDPDTRAALAKVAAATALAGHPVYVTVSNKAEGSAPQTVRLLAQAIRDRL
ncbi:DUF72 domain-containing protein [Xylophilus ampelinus]|uniref:Uncharacterized protein YecE (DUF72 family) n=1 Tax=Xylophilus ampelinus TaxID=54067 RepID=A0A318SG80_9BURK|nr:DUF72 domain-containing protein [Xylophilus ampelinus]MCS4511865.1 DUF72 domain-containing protein [Xylophilus ampelinus]PYE73331.1 uncharacterized protein YecE (DUF72 family) [Xylophilus ampelinus]